MHRNGLLTCMTFPNPRETEPVLELEKRTSRLLLALVRLKAGVLVYPMYTAPVVFSKLYYQGVAASFN